MSQIQTARYEQFLRRLLRIVEGDILPQLQGDISPVLQMEEPSDPALLFWKGHNLAVGHVVRPAGVAENGLITLTNPPASSKLIDILMVHFDGSFDIGMQVQPGVGTGNAGSREFIDTRHDSLVTEPVLDLGTALSVLLLGNFFINASPNPIYSTIPWVLAPNTTLLITQDALNTVLEVSVVWLERTAEDSELATR